MDKILIAEDEKVTRLSYCRILQKEGFHVIEAQNGLEAVDIFDRERPQAVLLDLKMPVMDGVEAIGRLKGIDPSVPVIIVTAHGDISTAVETMKLGAYDFLTKPVEPGKLVLTVKRAVEKLSLEKEISRLHAFEDLSLESTLGKSPVMKKIVEQVKKVAASDLSVIIQGETGTGKTLLAKLIHGISSRAKKDFVKIDLANIPETLVESELFGYEKGAFTGATTVKKGFFETAEGGTVFLDDLENLSPFVQSKLLTVLENRLIYRLGGRKSLNLNLRIIAATHSDMQRSVIDGKFREDLFFRLGEFIITLPPLRKRAEDIPFLAAKFLDDASAEMNMPIKGMSIDAMNCLKGHHWHGNIRELKNVIRRAALLSGGVEIGADHIEFLLEMKGKEGGLQTIPLKEALANVEKEFIIKALEVTRGNKAKASAILQVDVKTLRSKMAEYGIR